MSNGIPILSREGTREILEEMSKPPADTPERRATFERMKELRPVVERALHLNKTAEKS